MTIGGYILPYILAEYKNFYKNVDILLQVNNTEEIIYKLLNRKIDLALIEGDFDRKKFKYCKYKDDELVLVVSYLHDFNKYSSVSNLGYSVMSKETVRWEVESGKIKILPIKGLNIIREFNFVFLKDSDVKFVKHFISFCLK